MPHTIRLHRVLRATPERIYRAFLDADAMVKWLPPNGFTAKVHHMDARVGGTFKMSFTNFSTGHSHSFGGEYLELTPHERLRYTDVCAKAFDAVFYPGGHGPLWDLAQDANSIRLIEDMAAAGKPVVAVCHAPGVLREVKGANGKSFVDGKKVTGFTNSEEAAAKLTDVVPFLVEDMLVERGGEYSKGADYQPHVVTDGTLITGQNPASSEPAARALLRQLAEQ